MLRSLIQKRMAILILLAIVASGIKTQAQQEKMFSQYMFNMLALNPAYAGNRDVLSATALYRNQWGGVPGAPKTMTFTIDAPLNSEKAGLGLQIYNDQIGIFNETGVFASYSFRVKLSERTTLSLGLQGGAINLNANYLSVQTSQGQFGADPSFAENFSKILPNFGGGIFLSNDRGYFGISMPNALKNKVTSSFSEDATQQRHVYGMAGFVLGSGAFKVKPSMLAKYVTGFGVGLDGNVNFWFNDRIAIGGSYRWNQTRLIGDQAANRAIVSGDAIVAMLELQLTPQFRLGYAYDWTVNGFSQNGKIGNIPSHEFMLRYEFGFSKSKILTPRYF